MNPLDHIDCRGEDGVGSLELWADAVAEADGWRADLFRDLARLDAGEDGPDGPQVAAWQADGLLAIGCVVFLAGVAWGAALSFWMGR